MAGYADKPSAYAAARLQSLTPLDLVKLRELYAADRATQNILAPIEHQSYVREFSSEAPMTAAFSMPLAIPAYTIAKYLNLPGAQKTRSDPSMQEIYSGFGGLGEGLLQAGQRGLRGLLE